MGYTHYNYRSKDIAQDQWEKIAQETLDALAYCEKKKILLAWDYNVPKVKGKPKPPEVSGSLIRFNGWRDEGHETFLVTRERPENQSWQPYGEDFFDFCKTGHKPYDLAVCLVLLSMKRHAPDSVRISSDGEWDGEWTEARKVYKELFGVDVECPWDLAEV